MWNLCPLITKKLNRPFGAEIWHPNGGSKFLFFTPASNERWWTLRTWPLAVAFIKSPFFSPTVLQTSSKPLPQKCHKKLTQPMAMGFNKPFTKNFWGMANRYIYIGNICIPPFQKKQTRLSKNDLRHGLFHLSSRSGEACNSNATIRNVGIAVVSCCFNPSLQRWRFAPECSPYKGRKSPSNTLEVRVPDGVGGGTVEVGIEITS